MSGLLVTSSDNADTHLCTLQWQFIQPAINAVCYAKEYMTQSNRRYFSCSRFIVSFNELEDKLLSATFSLAYFYINQFKRLVEYHVISCFLTLWLEGRKKHTTNAKVYFWRRSLTCRKLGTTKI